MLSLLREQGQHLHLHNTCSQKRQCFTVEGLSAHLLLLLMPTCHQYMPSKQPVQKSNDVEQEIYLVL
jgi:hypothetical protein